MNYLFNTLLGFVLLLLSTVIVGQQIEYPDEQSDLPVEYILTQGANKYIINGTFLNYKNLSTTYFQSPDLKALTAKVNSQVSGARVFGVLTGLVIGRGIIAGRGCDGLDCIGSTLIILGSIPLGIIAIVFKTSSVANKKRSVDLFNQRQFYKKKDLSLQIESTQNGVGLILRF